MARIVHMSRGGKQYQVNFITLKTCRRQWVKPNLCVD